MACAACREPSYLWHGCSKFGLSSLFLARFVDVSGRRSMKKYKRNKKQKGDRERAREREMELSRLRVTRPVCACVRRGSDRCCVEEERGSKRPRTKIRRIATVDKARGERVLCGSCLEDSRKDGYLHRSIAAQGNRAPLTRKPSGRRRGRCTEALITGPHPWQQAHATVNGVCVLCDWLRDGSTDRLAVKILAFFVFD